MMAFQAGVNCFNDIRSPQKGGDAMHFTHFFLPDLYVLNEQRKYVQNLIKDKKQEFYKEKLRQNVGKPKELWKTLKSLGLPNKSSSWTKTCLSKDGIKHFDDKSNATIFKDFFCDLAKNLVSKLPSPSKKFCVSSLNLYYEKYKEKNSSKFHFSHVSSEDILNLLDKIDPDKAAGIDNISGKFLRDSASILAMPIYQFCNISLTTKYMYLVVEVYFY